MHFERILCLDSRTYEGSSLLYSAIEQANVALCYTSEATAETIFKVLDDMVGKLSLLFANIIDTLHQSKSAF